MKEVAESLVMKRLVGINKKESVANLRFQKSWKCMLFIGWSSANGYAKTLMVGSYLEWMDQS